MSLYVLDTDHASLFQHGHPQVTTRIRATSPDSLAITIITAEEQLRGRLSQVRKAQTGAERTRAYQRLREAIAFLSHIRILDYPLEASRNHQVCLPEASAMAEKLLSDPQRRRLRALPGAAGPHATTELYLSLGGRYP